MRVRAMIVDKKRILLIKRTKQENQYWVFPGGGVETFDSSPETALLRECQEELGMTVKVGQLFETYKGNEEELFFLCDIVSGNIGKIGGPESTRDKSVSGKYEPMWLPIEDIADKNILPQSIKKAILKKMVDK